MGVAGSILDDELSSPRQGKCRSPKGAASSSSSCPCFPVSLGFWPDSKVSLPSSFYLRIAYESLDFVDMDKTTPLVQFPFQNILCWGSSPQNFQFKVFDLDSVDDDKPGGGVLITLKTSQGKMIEDVTMSNVKQLMLDIKQRAISDGEFGILLATILDADNSLREDWLSIIDQFTSSGRLFLAKQGMELLLRIGQQAPFEKFDLVCMIYDRMLNKNSIQLLVNTFEDPQERENLSHRLKVSAAAAAKKSAASTGTGTGTGMVGVTGSAAPEPSSPATPAAAVPALTLSL